jgi:hypothetical protein
MENHKVYYREGIGVFFPKVAGCVKLVFEVVVIEFVTPFVFNLH